MKMKLNCGVSAWQTTSTHVVIISIERNLQGVAAGVATFEISPWIIVVVDEVPLSAQSCIILCCAGDDVYRRLFLAVAEATPMAGTWIVIDTINT